ncbi:MAG: sigma-70 family RNA polymerase sigma factor [Actinomycetota bacterium]|nr:sigma-70 family RNA polymerase sigma factor [Actinomycetota bacterium]
MLPVDDPAVRFEADRERLRAIAFRILGSLDDADDALQLAWVRVARTDRRRIENPSGWLTTVVSRVCLDLLRARRTRMATEALVDDRVAAREATPEDDALMAESVGRALLVVLDRLSPAERVAFVLHDLFAVPFDEIAEIVDRSQAAAKKLASRARRRVRGDAAPVGADVDRHRAIVEAFLAASAHGDLATLVELLAPDVVRRADRVAVPDEVASDVRGARAVAEETRVFAHLAGHGEVASVDGAPGIVVAPGGHLAVILRVRVERGRITRIDVVADPDELRRATITVPVG